MTTPTTAITMAPPGNGAPPATNGDGKTEMLALILAKLERMEQRLDHYEALVQQTLPMVGMMTDTVDGWMHELTRSGINIDERTKETLRLLAELTAPQSMETLHTLVEMLPTLGALVRQAPGAIAAMVDTGDELVMHLREAGIDIEHLGRRGLHAAKALIDSNVLEDAAVAVISNAAQSLEESACTARPTSLFGMIRAMGDPDVQRALGFFLAFAKSFGSRCKTSA